jgi:lipoate-protein ligase A
MTVFPPSTWRLLLDPPARGAWNMAVDEAILEHIGRGAAIPTLRLYDWTPACLSLGYAQPFKDVDVVRLKERGWDVVRRPTGGRAILHVDELTYSVTAPLDEPRVAGSVLDSYNRLAAALFAAVRWLDVPVQVKEHQPGLKSDASGPVCFEVPSTYEITANGKKLVGSAQARRREGVLQHGTLPLFGDLTRITQALVFTDEGSRIVAGEKLLAKATTVEAALGRQVTWQEAASAFIQAFSITLNLTLQSGELSTSELQRAAQLVEEKYAHASWIERV